MHKRAAVLVTISLCGAWPGWGQQAPAVPVHQLGKRLATTTTLLKSVIGVRQLSDGRVLVNDAATPQLLLFDSTLTTFTVVADSSVGTAKSYTVRGSILPYEGDTTMLFDPVSTSFLVIDPRGKIARITALPIPADAAFMQSLGGTVAAFFDPRQRLVYKTTVTAASRPSVGPGGRGFMRMGPGPAVPDSTAAIVRTSWATHAADTLGYIRLPKPQAFVPFTTPEGAKIQKAVIEPITIADDWTVTSAGVVALIRAQDYHIDWINPDGARSATKIPINWHRLSDSEKVAIVDTMRAFAEAHPSTGGTMVDGQMVSYKYVNDVTAPGDLADYVAPFRLGTVLPDVEGNVWLLPTPVWSNPRNQPKPTDAGLIYDVVNPARGLVDRVQITAGMSIVGFGPGVVYLASREGAGTALLRVRTR